MFSNLFKPLTIFLLLSELSLGFTIPPFGTFSYEPERNQSTGMRHARDVPSISIVLQSAAEVLAISAPADGLNHKVSSLASPSTLSGDQIDNLQYNYIRLLSDWRCTFETPNSILVVGGGLPTSLPVGPPQLILAIGCAPDLGL